MTRTYFVACTLGLEATLAAELRRVGAGEARLGRGGVHLHGDLRTGYLACLWSRTAIRVQEEIGRGRVIDDGDLYGFTRSFDWSRIVTPDQTLAVQVALSDNEAIRHSGYAAQRVKDAIVDGWRERAGRRPSVDRKQPDVPLKLVLRGEDAILYRDLVGPSLHKRGYRPIQVKSPLNEALAAGIILLSGWDRESPLLDPLCGSATLVIEAACLARGIAPGLERRFPFFRWPDFDDKLWRDLLQEARASISRELPGRLQASDRHPGSLELAKRSAQAAGVSDAITFTCADVSDYRPVTTPRVVVTNPPYGVRIGEGEDLERCWRGLGALLRERCAGADAWVLSGDPGLSRHLGLRASSRHPLKNGAIDCRLLHYEIHARRD